MLCALLFFIVSTANCHSGNMYGKKAKAIQIGEQPTEAIGTAAAVDHGISAGISTAVSSR